MKNNTKKSKIQTNLQKKFLTACLLCFGVGGILVSIFVRNILYNSTKNTVVSEFAQIHNAIENTVANYYYASYTIQNLQNVITSINTAQSDEDSINSEYEIGAQLNLLAQVLSLYSITLYLDDQILYRDNIFFRSVKELEQYDEFREFQSNDKSYIWLPPEQHRDANLQRIVTVIPFLRKIGSNKSPVAYQKCLISLEELQNMMSVNPFSDKRLILYSTANQAALIDLDFGSDKHSLDLNDNILSKVQKYTITPDWFKLSSPFGSFLTYAQNITGTDWILIVMIPQSYLWRILFYILIIWVITFFILIFVYRYFSKKYSQYLVQRIQLLENNMNLMLQEEYIPINYNDNKENDELDFIIQDYNSLLEKFQDLYFSRVKMEQEKRQLELNLIQAQINPHFLYNTLDLIKWKALDADVPIIADIIYMLSDFYKLSLGNGYELVTVKDEIRHIDDYIHIQNYRFSTHIQLLTEIPEELLECRLPKITLQPLVENSIQHGFLVQENQHNCIIELYGWAEENTLVLLIVDNGAGMSEEQLDTILSSSKKSKLHGFGVQNINERIQLYCGDSYGLSYDSTPGVGTSVTIRIKKTL